MHPFQPTPPFPENEMVKAVEGRASEVRPPSKEDFTITAGYLAHFAQHPGDAQCLSDWVCAQMAANLAKSNQDNALPQEDCDRDTLVLLRYSTLHSTDIEKVRRAFETALRATQTHGSDDLLGYLPGPILARAALANYSPAPGTPRFDGSPMPEYGSPTEGNAEFLKDMLRVYHALRRGPNQDNKASFQELSAHERLEIQCNNRRAMRYLADHLIYFANLRGLIQKEQLPD